jgi:peroxiredoxin Q/BCP
MDTLEKQKEFTDKEKLNFPLIADPEKKAVEAYGVYNPDNKLAKRVTFVIDKKGVVRKIYDKMDLKKHPDDVLAYIKENLAEKK